MESKIKYNNNESRLSQSSFNTTEYEGGNAEVMNANNQGEVQSSKSKGSNAKERVFYADWLRGMAIVLVIFVHTLCNSFDASGLDPDEVPTI